MIRQMMSRQIRCAQYVLNMLPTLNTDALFADESVQFITPMEPKVGDMVKVRMRTARANVDEVWYVSDHERVRMKFEKTIGAFDYYSLKHPVGSETIHFHYEVINGASCVYLGKTGVVNQLEDVVDFRICPGFATPDWAKGAVMYQIFTDRFCNGDPSNDVLDNEYRYIEKNVHRIQEWDTRPEPMDVRNFYGGDLEGVRQKLDYLKALGIEVIYFNPLFVSPSNHKYDTQDYDHIDPHFGKIVVDEGDVLPDSCARNRDSGRYISRVTRMENLEASDALFANVVEEAHKRGIRVILDGVFNHCGSFNKWMDREKIYDGQPGYEPGAFVSKDSPYKDFFYFYNTADSAWPDNDSYAGWWNHDTLPKMNYAGDSQLMNYILKIARKWVSPPYNADGWRLDVAADLGPGEEFNHMFWKAFRHEVKDANPDAVIIAEHYGDAAKWLAGDEWDTVMNYDAFMEPLTWFFTGMEKHSDAFIESQLGNADSFFGAMRAHQAAFMHPSLLCTMNELSNHDHSRFLTRTNHKTGRILNYDYDAAADGVDPAVMREAVVMQMTWPGAPTIYYGDEAGVVGFTDPDNRRTYPWGHEDSDMLDFHRAAIALHNAHNVLRTGSLKFLEGSYQYLSYARFDFDEQIVVAFNNSFEEKTVLLPVWEAGVPMDGEMIRVFATDRTSFTCKEEVFEVRQGEVTVTLPPTSSIVLCAKGS